MKKLILGIVDFRSKLQPEQRETFARLALRQTPDVLFIACSDSRVVPNLFASTEPGDLFVIRNVGGLIPPSYESGISSGDESEAAAIEFALTQLQVKDIIVCGHSECGAMRATVEGREKVRSPNLRSWLRLVEPALNKMNDKHSLNADLAPHNHLSQLNVLEQLNHLRSYPLVMDRIKAGELNLHGWWFDIARAEVLAYEESLHKFIVIDEAEAQRILERMNNPVPVST